MKQAVTLIIPLIALSPGLLLSHPQPKARLATQVVAEAPKPKAPLSEQAAIPAESLYQLLAAELALDRDGPDIALANYIAAAKETQDPKVAERATQIAISFGSIEQAIAPALLWASADVNNLEAQITVAALYLRSHQVAKAIPYLQHIDVIAPQKATEYYGLLYDELLTTEENAVLKKALQTIASQRTQLSAYCALAQIALKENHGKLALQWSQKAIKINPQDYVAITSYAESLRVTQGEKSADQFIRQALQQNPTPALRTYYARFAIANGIPQQARHQIQLLLKNPGLPPEALIQLAQQSIENEQFELAELILMQSRQSPDYQDISHYFLARTAQLQHNDNKALQWFKLVLTGPYHTLSQIRASLLLKDKKEYDKALAVLDKTQVTNPSDDKQVLLSKIDILLAAKRYKAALEYLNAELGRTPDDADYLYARSLIAEQLKHYDLAEQDLKKIIDNNPQHVQALNALGFILADNTNRFEESWGYLSRALAIAPENAAVLDSLGWLQYKMGNLQKAIEILNHALALEADEDILAHQQIVQEALNQQNVTSSANVSPDNK